MSDVVASRKPDSPIGEPMRDGTLPPKPSDVQPSGFGWSRIVRVLSVLGLLYIFLLSIGFIETGFKTGGKPLAEALISTTTNPFIGLFIGILATSLIQSSSTTTSLVVGLVAADALTLRNAVPFIMGANIGTSVTNTFAALGSVTRKEEFKRAFAAATVHDFFNFMTVILLFPLEMKFHFLESMAVWISAHLLGIEGGSFTSPVKMILKPVTHAFRDLLQDGLGMARPAVVVTLVATGLGGLFLSLVYLSQTLRRAMASASENAVRKVVGANMYLALVIGTLLTVSVQSSSITTSLFVPLVGTGLLTLEQVYPLMLGANVGTTVTALLASMVGNAAAIAIALTHLCFNVVGILIFLPMPFMRWPVWIARRFANWATERRAMAIVYILVAFFGIPGFLIWLTR
ncbi:MAG: Na/Pi symporter [Candidatus Krumholzibacteriia bacterium]